MSTKKFDSEAARQTLKLLYEPYLSQNQAFIEVRGKAQDEGRMTFKRFYRSIDQLIEDMSRWNIDLNYWFGVALRRNNTGGKKEDCLALTALFCDIDYGEAGHRKANKWNSREEALEAIKKFPLPPSLLIHSGGGYQAYWLLRQPVEFKGGESGN